MSPEPEKRSDEEEWGRLADAATPGPWHIEESAWDIPGAREVDRIVCGPNPQGVPRDGIAEVFDGHWVSGEEEPGPAPNLHFIAAARTAVPSLLAALAASRADNERISAAWAEVIQREQRTENAALYDIAEANAERDAARVEVSQLRAKVEQIEAHDEWATREREHFRNQMFVERDRTERAEARIGAALAWLDDADPLPERNGNIFADLRAALAEPLGSTPDPPATEEKP